MFLQGGERHSRSIAKAVSWRTLGSIDTFLLGWFFTGNVGAAGAIASTEVLTKLTLYYVHERGWSLVRWGTVHELPADPIAQPAE
ncbi:conserved hypothetical protein [Sphingomonas sp. EC-HK361]|uniref:DUF2061 domain-containing protein n=1 Tax=Sphingomonas sp. EC-HK361 TaxID=2038397 RepID=UPI0012540860|nr:DUF2061 domain-containing protein [Sphingomonas sp. EC-HK361]VVT22577.1 conserved hypothetical protein [Sphingomonas sp. EC-HK361]